MSFDPKRYAIIFIIITVVLAVISFAVDWAFGFEIPTGAATIIPSLGAAMYEGQKYAERTRDPIPQIWRQAWIMAVINLAISLVVMAVFMIIWPDLFTVVRFYAGYIVVAMLVGLLFLWVVNRFFFGFGARQAWKAADLKRGG